MKDSMVQVYTGDGKGKTTAAFGLALRAAGRGLNTLIIQFLKNRETGETIAAKDIPQIEVVSYGTGHFFKKGEETEEDIREAKKGIERCKEAIEENSWDLIVLDEINIALDFKLLDLGEVITLINKRGDKELILTGRNAPDQIKEEADLVTFMEAVKHPYDEGLDAREGIEY